MPVSTRCPKCKKKIKIPDGVRGKKLTCPRCKNRIKAPGPVAKRSELSTGTTKGTTKTEAPPSDKRVIALVVVGCLVAAAAVGAGAWFAIYGGAEPETTKKKPPWTRETDPAKRP